MPKVEKTHRQLLELYYPALRILIRQMNYKSQLYRLLRDELSTLGYWQARPRGNPAKGYQAMREKINKH